MGSSPGFGSTPRDFRRPVQTRFRSGCARDWLSLATKRNSPVHSSIGTPSARLGAFDCLRAHGFRNCFTPLNGVLFTFPSRYWSAIGHFEYLALGSGLPRFPRAFAVPRGTQVRRRQLRRVSATGLSPAMAALSRAFAYPRSLSLPPLFVVRGRVDLQHQTHRGRRPIRCVRFGLFPVRSPLLRELFLFLGVLRCFISPGCLHRTYVFSPR